MTVAVNDRTTGPLQMTGGETLLPFDWRVLSAADLAVWRARGGATEQLAPTTDYSVDGVGAANGGDVVLATAALQDDVYVVEGLRPAARISDLAYSQALPPALLNSEYDSLQIQLAEIRRDVSRALKVSRFETEMLATELPPVEPGMAIGFDADGNLDFVAGSGGGGAIPDPLPVGDGGTGATDAPTARANLGLAALATRNSVGAAEIDAGAVGSSELAAEAVTADKTAKGVVTWTVESGAVTLPPGLPQDGKAWLIPASGATGAWAGKGNQIALGASGAWVFYVPAKGWRAVALAERRVLAYDGSVWLPVSAGLQLAGVIATALPANRFGGGLTRSAIVNGRHVVVWGSGAGGKNALTGARTAPLPERVPFQGTAPASLKQLVSGDGIHFVIDDQDDVWSAGDGQSGCLGHGDTTDQLRFKRIEALVSAGVKIQQIYVGSPGVTDSPTVFFLTTTGTLKACGQGVNGERGDGTVTAIVSTPVDVLDNATGLALTGVVALSVGAYPASPVALHSDATMSRWGYNFYGQLGLGDTTLRNKAHRHATLSGIAEVLSVSGPNAGTILVRTSAGLLHGAGSNTFGQLAQGAGDLTNKSVFVAITHGETFKKVVGAGEYATFAGVTATDKAVLWGRNLYGQCGTGNTTDQSTIFEPSAAWQGAVTDIFVAGNADTKTSYVRVGNVLYAAGYNAVLNGCIGGDSVAAITTFTEVEGLEGESIAAWHVMGSSSNYGPIVLTSDGRILTGGPGGSGELGWQVSPTLGNSAVLQEVMIRGLRGMDGIDGVDGAPGGSTSLSIANRTTSTLDVASDTGNDATVPAATTSLSGVMTGADKTKLDGIEAGATADMSNAEIAAVFTYAHTQGSASNVWTITHNLGRYPLVLLMDAGGNRFDAPIVDASVNQLVVTLSTPLAGSARCI